MAKKATLELVEIRYDLFDLPTAQHKAGLAGLILAIRSLKERSEKDPEAIPPESVPEILEGPDATSVKVRLTERSLQGIMDDAYDVKVSESEPEDEKRKRSKGRVIITPCRTSQRTCVNRRRETEVVEEYVYLRFAPRFSALEGKLPNELWFKLWQDLMLDAIRDSNKRGPFKRQAIRRCKDTTWEACAISQYGSLRADPDDDIEANVILSDFQCEGQTEIQTQAVSGSLWIGAQGMNAERIEFKGYPCHNLLLHFWPLAVLVFVPSFIDSDGKEHLGKRGEKDKNSHYIIAVPEVSGLRRFCELYPRMLSRLGEEKCGYRPAAAVITVAAQSSLEFINHIAQLAEQTAAGLLSRGLSSVEFYHLMKPKPNKGAVLVGSGRVPDNPDLIDGYRDIVGRPGELPPYRNPLFKAALILALLRGKPWWGELLPLFMSRDARFFFAIENTLNDIAWMVRDWNQDIRNRFNIDKEKYKHQRDLQMQMSKNDPQASAQDNQLAKRLPRPLDLIIHDVAQQYVLRRAEARENLPRKNDVVDWASQQAEKAKAEAARDAFLALRSRRDQAFIEHFTELFGQFGQFLRVPDEFLTLTAALHDETERVKTVTLLALSANGYVRKKTESDTTASEDKP